MIQPKVFISYSWSPAQNKNWVINFAERLSSDYVHVMIDVWDAKEGQDKYQFMEQMVNNPEIDKVLIICNIDYALKANDKKGGVGIESQIISSELYEKVSQEKFIPVVREYSDGKPCLPTFVKSRFFIDLSDSDRFEENYEQLIRNLFNKPKSQRPPVGTPPVYLIQDEPTQLRTAFKVTTIKNAFENNKPNYQAYIDDYYDLFLLSLTDLELGQTAFNDKEPDDVIVSQIEKFTQLRDNFVDFIDLMLKYKSFLDLEILHRFWEKVLQYHLSKNGLNHSTNSLDFLLIDHFNFINYELFIYFTAICIKKEEFNCLSYILHHAFLIQESEVTGIVPRSFAEFNIACTSLNKRRNNRLNLRRVNLQADLIRERAKNDYVTFDDLKIADILLHYISQIIPYNKDIPAYATVWFPHLAAYRIYRVPQLDKMISLRYFNKIKKIFDVETIDELIMKVDGLNEVPFSKNRFFYEYPSLKSLIDRDKIGKIN